MEKLLKGIRNAIIGIFVICGIYMSLLAVFPKDPFFSQIFISVGIPISFRYLRGLEGALKKMICSLPKEKREQEDSDLEMERLIKGLRNAKIGSLVIGGIYCGLLGVFPKDPIFSQSFLILGFSLLVYYLISLGKDLKKLIRSIPEEKKDL